MKFGRTLQENIYPEWKFYYIDYDGLKKILKERGPTNSFSEGDEAIFVEALEKEMIKVFDFRDVKGGELTRHVQHCETVVDHINSDNVNELKAIEEEIGRITMELSQLATFSRLNYTGFIKILKKHDKHTEYMLTPMFMLRLKTKPLYLENLDSLILRLSKLYDRIRSGNTSNKSPKEIKQTDAMESGAQVFVRKTSKYWVHSDNVTEVKCYVLKYLPVLIYPSKKRKIDLAVSSVYLDNDQMELYQGRLEKSEGALAIRIRWYGSDEPKEVFIERKIHREDWTGEISVKSRFPLKEKYVTDFLKGSFTPEEVVRKISKDGKRNEEELEEIRKLAKEIQDVVISKKLKPMIRTVYNRTAFQLPGDARVRISLDTELTMIREDGPKRSGENWKREDIETNEYPFTNLGPSEIIRFPHAILEVKLQTHAGQEPPQWATNLTKSHLVEEVPKFSKFIHGCATLFPKKINTIPFWLPQMEVDIRKPLSLSVEVIEDDSDDGPVIFSSGTSSSPDEKGTTDHLLEASTSTRPVHTVIPMIEEEEADNVETPLLGNNISKKPRKKGILSFITGSKHSRIGPEGVKEGGGGGDGSKKIFIPVRVEPKVFFANERTFLSWVHFSIFLGGIATALVGLGNHHARLSGYLFGIVSILFTAYALYLYQWRATRIREKDPGPYDDRIGPIVVVAVFMAAMVVNMVFAVWND